MGGKQGVGGSPFSRLRLIASLGLLGLARAARDAPPTLLGEWLRLFSDYCWIIYLHQYHPYSYTSVVPCPSTFNSHYYSSSSSAIVTVVDDTESQDQAGIVVEETKNSKVENMAEENMAEDNVSVDSDEDMAGAIDQGDKENGDEMDMDETEAGDVETELLENGNGNEDVDTTANEGSAEEGSTTSSPPKKKRPRPPGCYKRKRRRQAASDVGASEVQPFPVDDASTDIDADNDADNDAAAAAVAPGGHGNISAELQNLVFNGMYEMYLHDELNKPATTSEVVKEKEEGDSVNEEIKGLESAATGANPFASSRVPRRDKDKRRSDGRSSYDDPCIRAVDRVFDVLTKHGHILDSLIELAISRGLPNISSVDDWKREVTRVAIGDYDASRSWEDAARQGKCRSAAYYVARLLEEQYCLANEMVKYAMPSMEGSRETDGGETGSTRTVSTIVHFSDPSYDQIEGSASTDGRCFIRSVCQQVVNEVGRDGFEEILPEGVPPPPHFDFAWGVDEEMLRWLDRFWVLSANEYLRIIYDDEDADPAFAQFHQEDDAIDAEQSQGWSRSGRASWAGQYELLSNNSVPPKTIDSELWAGRRIATGLSSLLNINLTKIESQNGAKHEIYHLASSGISIRLNYFNRLHYDYQEFGIGEGGGGGSGSGGAVGDTDLQVLAGQKMAKADDDGDGPVWEILAQHPPNSTVICSICNEKQAVATWVDSFVPDNKITCHSCLDCQKKSFEVGSDGW